MKKIVSCSLTAVFLLTAVEAFCQFKSSARSARNLANLEKMIARAERGAAPGRPVVTNLPPNVIRGNSVGLLRVKKPALLTPVNKSYVNHLKILAEEMTPLYGAPTKEGLVSTVADEWLVRTGNRALYTDQNELARDLNDFYEGNASVWISPEGRAVKLYALPINGILYKPAEYQQPLALMASEHFIIYDIEARTGQIAENKPAIYNLFRPRDYDAIWQAMGASKEFDDLENLCDAILVAHLHKARLDQQMAKGAGANISALVQANRSDVWAQLNETDRLLEYIKQLPKVRQVANGAIAYVIKLPVEGLTWVDRDNVLHIYNEQDYVMLFFEMGSAGIFPRKDVENPQIFESMAK